MPEDVVFLFPDHLINYGLVLVHKLFLHNDNDEIPKISVRPPVIKFNQASSRPTCFISHSTISGPQDIFLSVRIYSAESCLLSHSGGL